MTSKLHKKVSSVLAVGAICALLALIVLLWCVFARQGQPPSVKASDLETNVTSTKECALELAYGQGKCDVSVLRVVGIYFKPFQTTVSDLGATLPSHVLDYAKDVDTELVRLVKVGPKPIEGHDFIYDLKKFPRNSTKTRLEHDTGHFRHVHTFLWDPHPEYTIRAFGAELRLALRLDAARRLPVTQLRRGEAARRASPAPSCFYSGAVVGDPRSWVAVSLCGGMTGYIKSKEGNFYIEPAEEYQNSSAQTSVLHRIHKIRSSEEANLKDVETCDTKMEEQDNHIIFDDIFTEEHHVSKRSTWLDYHYEPTSASYQSKNREYFIEILVVVDKTMYDYHKTNDTLIHYILTLMSHVSLLYKDATIGNPVSLFVKDIIILPEKIFVARNSKHLGVNSGEMLKNFCNFQQSMKSFANGHDVAILLTRETICRNTATGQCDTLGLAELGTMCSKENSCAIIKDKGLPTSYTIAHELGHVLNIPHDDDLEKCSKYNEKDAGLKYIMGRMLKNDSKPWLWSSCSRKFLTHFLESKRANCLLNKPNKDLVDNYNNNQLPGEDFSADKQCELVFGPGLKLCPYMPKCSYLWCELNTNHDGGCQTQHQPWADGTICEPNFWCMRGECVPIDLAALQPIAGGWGPWKVDGPCSRTCGGGVRHVVRACDSPRPQNGGAYCLGPSTRYESCHTEACAEDAQDFRELQCARFDGNSMGVPGLSGQVKWVPKYEGISPEEHCILYCRVAHTNQHYLLAERVADGTKCGFNSHDLCVAGACRRGGCDNKLGSALTLDRCGVCGGDNSRCQQVDGHYHAKPSHGYSKVVRIPKGSSNLDIRQHGWERDGNYLALVDSDTGQYVLNGNYILHAYPTVFMYGGVAFSYTGTDVRVERINSSNSVRLKKDLLVELLAVDRLQPPNISYSYMIARGRTPRYSWQLYADAWGPCSRACGGEQRPRPLCTALATGQVVAHEFCDGLPRDAGGSARECNTHCRLMWRVKHRLPCSAACGPGLQPVEHECVRVEELLEQEDRWGTPVDEQHCSDLPRPPELEACEGACEDVRWHYEEWSACSRSCAGGSQQRAAHCVSASQAPLPPGACAHLPAATARPCNAQRCPAWAVAEWTACNATCTGAAWGQGHRLRPYYCHTEGRVLQPDKCDPNTRPHVVEECELPCPRWEAGPWQPCDCIQRRVVTCVSASSAALPPSACAALLRPDDTRPCASCSNSLVPSLPPAARPAGRPAEWRSGPWAPCSRACGPGRRQRQVVCQDADGAVVDEDRCRGQKPVAEVPCEDAKCGEWSTGDWSECTSSCERYRLVLCLAENGSTLPGSRCPAQPAPANSSACAGCHRWAAAPWGPCSAACGRGLRARAVACVDAARNASVAAALCRAPRPRAQRPCRRSHCSHAWAAGPWTACTRSCGPGMRYRNVTCHRVLPHGRAATQGSEHTCDQFSRPPSYEKCSVRSCEDLNDFGSYTWGAGPWKVCSHPCGSKGRQIRHIHCQYNGKRVPKKYCPKSTKPRRKQKCNQRKCSPTHFRSCLDVKRGLQTAEDGEYDMSVSDNNDVIQIYCHKMGAAIPEEFLSLRDEGRENYAEMYGQQLLQPDSCPAQGRRLDSCACRNASGAGLTVFHKLRLNVSSLAVLTDDFTFSRQVYGQRIAFASAGDCYSRRECPQGRFAVNLARTGLALSRRVAWRSSGERAAMAVTRHAATAHGKCGGYCGSCAPDPHVGLQLTPHPSKQP